MINKLNEIYSNQNLLKVIAKKLKVRKELILDTWHDVYIIIYNMINDGKKVDVSEGYIVTCVYREFLKNQDKCEELDFEIIDEINIDYKQDVLQSFISSGNQSSEEIYLIKTRMYKLETQEETSKKLNLTKNMLYYKQRKILQKLKNKFELYDFS